MLTAIGLYTGARLKDCALARFEDFHIEENVFHFSPAKTKRKHHYETYIPLHPVLKALILSTPHKTWTGYVLPEIAARYIHEPSIVTNRFQKTLREAGIETTTDRGEGKKRIAVYGFHSLRHFVNTWLINHGAKSIMVAKLLGHSVEKEAMTLRYYHENECELTAVIGTLPYLTAFNVACPSSTLTTPSSLISQAHALISRMNPDEFRVASKMFSIPVQAEVVA